MLGKRLCRRHKAFFKLLLILCWCWFAIYIIHPRSPMPDQERVSPCPAAGSTRTPADINTLNVFLHTLDFKYNWTEKDKFWNEELEQRLEKARWPLRVFLLPISHNDPGWLRTFEGYFREKTKHILDGAVKKLMEYTDMTFTWSEMSFLSLWWSSATPHQRAAFKDLVHQGRLEILTGGWVMTDEASVHLFAMLDQLIEGHQFLRHSLDISAKHSWSIDPFGLGATFPYLLKASGIDAMAILRIHHAWKVHLAHIQANDFIWQQPWDSHGDQDILCHVFPYSLYSVRDSCGPNKHICLKYFFGTPPGFSTDYSQKVISVTPENVHEISPGILHQYSKTGSLFEHNVVLALLGEDFTFTYEQEWDYQYGNYSLIMEHINSHPNAYHKAKVTFGTMADYVSEVQRRLSEASDVKLPSLTGDFFPYSDDFSKVEPDQGVYWSGFFTSRPLLKLQCRDLQNHLRSSEILFSIAHNLARQRQDPPLQSLYGQLVLARRNLALFQHHDAITGTSRKFVMKDYGHKLLAATLATKQLHAKLIQYLLIKNLELQLRYVSWNSDWSNYPISSGPMLVDVAAKQIIVFFNSLTQDKTEIVKFRVTKDVSELCAFDPSGQHVGVQIGPYINEETLQPDPQFHMATAVVRVPPLTVFSLLLSADACEASPMSSVFCLTCQNVLKSGPLPQTVSIENKRIQLTFSNHSRLLHIYRDKITGSDVSLNMSYGVYATQKAENGAYLFKKKPRLPERVNHLAVAEVLLVKGLVYDEVISLFMDTTNAIPTVFGSSVRLYHRDDDLMSNVVAVENFLHLGSASITDLDFFVRYHHAGIRNLDSANRTVFYTDQNAFQMQKRVQNSKVNDEGQVYPITSMAYIEDARSRMTVLVNHAQGMTGMRPGVAEFMVDRRSSADDHRGLEQALTDTVPTKHSHWIVLEPRSCGPADAVSLPSQSAHLLARHLDYPAPIFTIDHEFTHLFHRHRSLTNQSLANDQFLLNLRTLPSQQSPESAPSSAALAIFHSQMSDCNVGSGCQPQSAFHYLPELPDLRLQLAVATSLTGVHLGNSSDDVASSGWPARPMQLQSVMLSFH